MTDDNKSLKIYPSCKELMRPDTHHRQIKRGCWFPYKTGKPTDHRRGAIGPVGSNCSPREVRLAPCEIRRRLKQTLSGPVHAILPVFSFNTLSRSLRKMSFIRSSSFNLLKLSWRPLNSSSFCLNLCSREAFSFSEAALLDTHTSFIYKIE